jgi:hypothetical protein
VWDSERHSSHSVIEPYGTFDPPALNIERDGSAVEQKDLPCPEGDDMEKWHKRSSMYTTKPVTALTLQQLERQRKRNRIYIRKFRASLSKRARRREKNKLLKRRKREANKHKK